MDRTAILRVAADVQKDRGPADGDGAGMACRAGPDPGMLAITVAVVIESLRRQIGS